MLTCDHPMTNQTYHGTLVERRLSFIVLNDSTVCKRHVGPSIPCGAPAEGCRGILDQRVKREDRSRCGRRCLFTFVSNFVPCLIAVLSIPYGKRCKHQFRPGGGG